MKKTCWNCRYEDCEGYQQPCNVCKRNYANEFKKKKQKTAVQETKNRMTQDFVDAGVINHLELARENRQQMQDGCYNTAYDEMAGYYEQAINQESDKRIYFEEYAKEFKTELDTAEKRWNELKEFVSDEFSQEEFVGIEAIREKMRELEKDGDK